MLLPQSRSYTTRRSYTQGTIEDGVWSRFGLAHGINAGDALCAMAFLQLLEGPPRRSPDQTVLMTRALHAANFELCGGDKAAIFAVACELGAMVAGASPERARAYARLGRSSARSAAKPRATCSKRISPKPTPLPPRPASMPAAACAPSSPMRCARPREQFLNAGTSGRRGSRLRTRSMLWPLVAILAGGAFDRAVAVFAEPRISTTTSRPSKRGTLTCSKTTRRGSFTPRRRLQTTRLGYFIVLWAIRPDSTARSATCTSSIPPTPRTSPCASW